MVRQAWFARNRRLAINTGAPDYAFLLVLVGFVSPLKPTFLTWTDYMTLPRSRFSAQTTNRCIRFFAKLFFFEQRGFLRKTLKDS